MELRAVAGKVALVMRIPWGAPITVALLAAWTVVCTANAAAVVQLAEKAPDPHGSPRPGRDARDVPLRTSIYFELATAGGQPLDALSGSLDVALKPEGGETIELLQPDRRFDEHADGWIRASGKSLWVYLEPGRALMPRTRYTVRVAAASGGATSDVASWSFTTEPPPAVHHLDCSLDFSAAPVRWHGQFFCGTCDVIFCTRAAQYGPTFDLM